MSHRPASREDHWRGWAASSSAPIASGAAVGRPAHHRAPSAHTGPLSAGRYPLLPFAQLAMSYLFTQNVPYQDMAGLLVGYLHYFMNDNLKPDDAVTLPPPKKGGRAAKPAAGDEADGARRKGGRKRKVIMNMAASSS